MIIRERTEDFVMIEQHDHAQLSRQAMEQWEGSRLRNDPFRESVLYAIQNHDRGWCMFDKQPFWNDAKGAPYAFTNFPPLAKTVLYQQGIDEVAENDVYAALLCSEHYCRFMNNHSFEEAQQFVKDEKERQKRIIKSIPTFDEVQFAWHFELLKFADNLSLYICLNEPGISKEAEHPFFKEGIPTASSVVETETGKIHANWKNEHTIGLTPFPFAKAFPVRVKEKHISKEEIEEHGILESYERAHYYENQVMVQN